MSENKRVTIPFLEKVLKPIVDLIKTKADRTDLEGLGGLTEEQVNELINAKLGAIEDGTY